MIIFEISELTKEHYFIKQTNNNNTINIKKMSINQASADDTPKSFFGVHLSYDLRIFS